MGGIFFHCWAIQVDFILMIIKNASVSYYKLSFKLGPDSLSTRIGNLKWNGILQGKNKYPGGNNYVYQIKLRTQKEHCYTAVLIDGWAFIYDFLTMKPILLVSWTTEVRTYCKDLQPPGSGSGF